MPHPTPDTVDPPHPLAEVLRQQAELGSLMEENRALEAYLRTQLAPRVQLRRLEVERLQEKVDRAQQARDRESEQAELQRRLDETRLLLSRTRAELAQVHAENCALRASASWRITAPARAALELLQRLRQRRTG
jgi:hypothetical protein